MDKSNGSLKGILVVCIIAVAALSLTLGSVVSKSGEVYGRFDTKIEALGKADEKFLSKEVYILTMENIKENFQTIKDDIGIIKKDIKIIAERK